MEKKSLKTAEKHIADAKGLYLKYIIDAVNDAGGVGKLAKKTNIPASTIDSTISRDSLNQLVSLCKRLTTKK